MKLPFIKEASRHMFSKPSTERSARQAAPGYRGKIVFHPERCINCGLCMRVCAANAISRTAEKQEDGEQVTLSFNLGSCTFCQMCADFCSKGAIEMSPEYAMVARDGESLSVSGSFFKKKPQPKAKPAEAGAAATAEKPAKAGKTAPSAEETAQ